jgi:hypothetical protein
VFPRQTIITEDFCRFHQSLTICPHSMLKQLVLCPSLILTSLLFLIRWLIMFADDTISMEQSPLEADTRSAGQGFPHLLLNPKVHYLVHKYPPMVHILSLINQVHTFIYYFLKIYFRIILHLSLGLMNVLFHQVTGLKFCMHLSAFTWSIHAPLISFSLIWSP